MISETEREKENTFKCKGKLSRMKIYVKCEIF